MEGLAISNEVFSFGSPFLALFCLVPFYLAFNNAKSYSESFWLFFLQSLTVHLISSFWLAYFHDFAIFTIGGSALGTSFIAGFCGIIAYMFISHFNMKFALEENGGRHFYAPFLRVLWFSTAWTCWEWVKSTGFLAYPWGTLSMAAYKWKLVTQIASITGVWGITFIFALFSAFLGEGVLLLGRIPSSQAPKTVFSNYRQIFSFVLVIFGATTAYGLFEYFIPRFPIKKMNTIVVQQNIDPWEGGEDSSISISKSLTEQKVQELKENGKKADLVLWSEGVLERQFPAGRGRYENYPQDESLSDFIKRMDTPFIIGGSATLNRQKRKYGNAAVLYDSNGKYSGFYCKMHLVPFAEVLPYADSPLMQSLCKAIVGFSTAWTPGNQYVVFQIPIQSMNSASCPLEYRSERSITIPLDSNGSSNPEFTEKFISNQSVNPDNTVKFTVPICFEDAFPDVCSRLYDEGSEVFMNITNDSWSKTDSAEYQHFIAASYLAIEYRTTLVRCANAGYSVVVDPSGRVIQDLPVFTTASLSAEVPIYKRAETVYSKYGDWFAYICLAFMAFEALYTLITVCHVKDETKAHFITITVGKNPRLYENSSNTDGQNLTDYNSSAKDNVVLHEKAIVKSVESESKKQNLKKTAATSKNKPAKINKKHTPGTTNTPASSNKQAASAKKKSPAKKEQHTKLKASKKQISAAVKPASTKKSTTSKKQATVAKKPSSSKKAAASKKQAPASKRQTSVKKTSSSKSKNLKK